MDRTCKIMQSPCSGAKALCSKRATQKQEPITKQTPIQKLRQPRFHGASQESKGKKPRVEGARANMNKEPNPKITTGAGKDYWAG